MNQRKMVFLGVSTGTSMVHRVFNRWSICLDSSLRLECIDLPVGSSRGSYRAFLTRIRFEYPNSLGALITSHKAALFTHASDLVDILTPESIALQEIGMLYWRKGCLVGGANDALSTLSVSSRLLNSHHWKSGTRAVVILGGGGAGVALANTLAGSDVFGVSSITICESDPVRAEVLEELISSWPSKVIIRVALVKRYSDLLVSNAGVGSLIANATGLGKDRVGSPVSTAVKFPLESTIWEFNYRFIAQDAPTFLEIAKSQENGNRLVLEDGWDYFIWGWLICMANILGVSPDDYRACFSSVASNVRSQ